jgi:hypothetical protein
VCVGEHVTGTGVRVIRTPFRTVQYATCNGCQPLNRKTMPRETQHQIMLGNEESSILHSLAAVWFYLGFMNFFTGDTTCLSNGSLHRLVLV